MRSRKAGAIAIFVKTPGLSQVKTRLAASVGTSAAETFHLLSAKAVESVVQHASNEVGVLTPYWAVAEKEALSSPHWQAFQTIWQGMGSLGERLFRVYDHLIQRHPFVIFIGADSPQLPSRMLEKSARLLSENSEPTFALGRAEDGGFYLFGGTRPIDREIWVGVPYSSESTATALARRIEPLGKVHDFPPLFDVDTVDDLAKLRRVGALDGDLTLEQCVLLRWVEKFFQERK